MIKKQEAQEQPSQRHCKYCSNKQNYDGEDRCARYHDSLCKNVYRFCNGHFFLHINDGISLFAMKSWLNRLTNEEMEMPLLFEYNAILAPLVVLKSYSANNTDGCWLFYAKTKEEEL